jgi:uncharacterized membrane protein YtjA (UPF0391 family)
MQMLNYALLFLLAGLIAVALGLAGIVAVPRQIAWTIFLAGVALLAIQLVMPATVGTTRQAVYSRRVS